MSDFRKVTDSFSASPQITEGDVAEARARGFALIVNNRPDAEVEGQIPGSVIEQACAANGLQYVAIPVTHAGFSQVQVDGLAKALKSAEGPVLAYCRSGTRSTLLWALAQAQLGEAPDKIAEQAALAGYDVAPIRGPLEMIAAQSGNSTS